MSQIEPMCQPLSHATQHNFRVMQVILHRFIKSAHVYAIHDSVMPLYA